jgi:hypothetical protein
MEGGYSQSGIRVTAQPPPPAPVNFVAKPYGDSVAATIISRLGWDTPSVTRCL